MTSQIRILFANRNLSKSLKLTTLIMLSIFINLFTRQSFLPLSHDVTKFFETRPYMKYLENEAKIWVQKRETSTSALDVRDLKVKDKHRNNSLPKNNCITISMQKISSIPQFILAIQILESHDLKDSLVHLWRSRSRINRDSHRLPRTLSWWSYWRSRRLFWVIPSLSRFN